MFRLVSPAPAGPAILKDEDILFVKTRGAEPTTQWSG